MERKWAGDVCLLAVPLDGVSRETLEFQTALKLHYGGRIVDFLHLTLQRFRCPPEVDPELLRFRFAPLARTIASMPFEANEAHVMYSAFRRCHIIKATIDHDPPALDTIRRANQILMDLGCELRYKNVSTIVTVLTDVERPKRGPLPTSWPQPLFTAECLVASLITESHDFEKLWQIELATGEPA
jgi:hypothetical protein